ncbi:serine/threonine protein kinase [Alkalicella caledoniensis]|uniref:Serine/threonine protein kinase n=1 Tax=Alkalicella caledoniensis TaxID=2731377 RepID=A0A7G9W646_ALKCA|nr:serine/threonine-protein kinase [Alkalicella caledoniensis]QNO14158.1 serine/threonine protein kinase [Alkalicella caledoniensis]
MSIDFEVIEKYKQSGQKEVYRINHQLFGECIFKKGKCLSKTSLERIKREVNILSELDSKYFPKNYEFQLWPTGEFIMFEEYISSKTLTECKADFKGDEKRVVSLMIEIIDGLELIWKKKIVHRDLKPDNILIKANEKPVIIDLGIARVLEDKSLTLTAHMNGPCTPIYASPEQIDNKKNSIDIRSDFYSLAIIMAELILGEHPFSPAVVGQGMSTFENMLHNKYRLEYENIGLSEVTGNLVNKLLNREPFQRLRTVGLLKEYLNKCLER